MTHSLRRDRKVKAIAEALAMLADAQPPLEHIPNRLVQSVRREYAQIFNTGAISDRSNDSIRSESALAPHLRRRGIETEDWLFESATAFCAALEKYAERGKLQSRLKTMPGRSRMW